MEKPLKAPGLIWRGDRPMWRASKAAVQRGYPVKNVNLSPIADDARAMAARCIRLQAEMRQWMAGQTETATDTFDGTIAGLLRIYQTDPESTYHKLKPSARHPYDVYARMLTMEVGRRRIDMVDGRDIRRWHAAWREPAKAGGRPKLAAAKMAIVVLKAALSFGKTCRMRGCAELKSILEEMTFPSPQPRTAAPTATQVIAARAAAHELGHPRAALAYAIQFETTARQWDVIGQWLPLSDARPSAVINRGRKWVGPTWSVIDDNLVMRLTPTKTEETSAAAVTFDLRLCPMVMEEMASIGQAERAGPLIATPAGLPYGQWHFRDLWRRCADRSGIDKSIWNRDLRAGGNTEAQQAGALLEDRKKVTGHTERSNVTAKVYDRDRLEAHRRVAAARNKYRENGQ